MVSPARRRSCVEHVARHLGVSERRACAVLGQHRSTQRREPRAPGDEARLTAEIVELARRFGRYGYRRVTALLRQAGWAVTKRIAGLGRGRPGVASFPPPAALPA
jgi:putative transposase